MSFVSDKNGCKVVERARYMILRMRRLCNYLIVCCLSQVGNCSHIFIPYLHFTAKTEGLTNATFGGHE